MAHIWAPWNTVTYCEINANHRCLLNSCIGSTLLGLLEKRKMFRTIAALKSFICSWVELCVWVSMVTCQKGDANKRCWCVEKALLRRLHGGSRTWVSGRLWCIDPIRSRVCLVTFSIQLLYSSDQSFCLVHFYGSYLFVISSFFFFSCIFPLVSFHCLSVFYCNILSFLTWLFWIVFQVIHRFPLV